ncbi:MAG TPA: 2TM domain-containing protein [Solirubrobacteraceae bacterium]|nr:2TM domain-containing protein [Solirubrobacteraceae bacterium]
MKTQETETFEEIIAGHRELLREQALQQLKKRRDFATHLFTYVLTNLVVWCIWLVIGLSSHSWWPWPVFVTLGWGIGIALNAWDVYMRHPITEGDLQREMRHLESR